MQPSLAATILTDLDESPRLRQLFREYGHLTTKWIATESLGRNPTSIESRAIVCLLQRVGWQQWRKARHRPPIDHPIRMAKDLPELTDQAMNRIRLLVGRSDLPEEYHAEVIQEIVQNAREWTISDNRVYYVINKVKKKLAPAPQDPEIEELRSDIVQWLEDPDTRALVASRPHRYVTAWEVIEGTMRVADTKMFRDVPRAMPWPKKKLRVGDKFINAFVQPSSGDVERQAPNLDELPAYIADKLVVVENEVLRDVCRLSARQVTPSDRVYVRTAMRSLGWKRERSLHGTGWIYMKKESM